MNADTNLQRVPHQGGDLTPIADSAALMAAVARAASDPTVDVEKMERLFAMHERMEAKQAERDYANAMMRAQKAMPVIAKERENKQTKSWYADMEAINKKIVPVYTAEGFSLSFGQADCPIADCVRVTCDVLHIGGHSKRFQYDNPIDDAGLQGAKNKTPTHGRASATTYAQRYITKMIFNLTLGDEDDDGNGAHPQDEPARISEEQEATLSGLIASTRSSLRDYLAWLKIDSLADLRASSYGPALALLKKKQALINNKDADA